MLALRLFLILALLFASTQSQEFNITALIADDKQLLTTLNNYFGCTKWNGTSCEKCSLNYYFNIKGICCEVSPQCKLFNQDIGICQQCYEGYKLYNGTCQILTPDQQINPGCVKWDGNHSCLQCGARFVPKAQDKCQAVSDNCRTWNTDSGACLTCYSGYVVSNFQCVINPSPFVPTANAHCKSWSNNLCVACQDTAYFDSKGICQPISDYCNTWDPQNGFCFTCYSGFVLINGACQLALNTNPSDLGCKIWNWTAQICLSCSQNWVFNSNKVCVPSSDRCATSDIEGQCLSCYKGYDLASGSCVFSPSNTLIPSDLGCKTWDWNNNKCLQCANWFYFDSNKKCVSVSNLCQTYDLSTGSCTSCFNGFTLNQGVCQTSNSNPVPDAGCANLDLNDLVCLSCSKNWILSNKKCLPVSDQCLTWDSNTGNCLSCYSGYNLTNGKCLISDLTLINPPDKGCFDWNWDAQICLGCSKRWYFNKAGVCTPVSDLCKTSDPNGNCLSCYDGYRINVGNCEADVVKKPSDLGCGKWDWSNQVCVACSNGFVFNKANVCTPISDLCKTYSTTGACASCFKGYNLIDEACVFSEQNNKKPSDQGCAKWDWDNKACLQCAKGFSMKGLMNGQKICVLLNDQCKTYDNNGDCIACFKGYDLVGGLCEVSTANSKSADPGCAKWDWDSQLCLSCSKNWVFNSSKICIPVSDQCKTTSLNSGLCISCYKGYDLIEGSCVLSASKTAKSSDSGCANWDWDNQICLRCSQNWVFNSNGLCVAVSDQCNTHNQNGQCTSCFKGYDLLNGKCVFSQSNNAKPLDLGCGNWDWNNQICVSCSKGYTFNSNKVCTPVSDQCKAYDSLGHCTSCFQGYDLLNGTCNLSAPNNAKTSNSGCGNWDWTNKVCLSCSKGFVFNANQICVSTSDQCKTFDSQTGACTSCFKGYDLNNNGCSLSASNNAIPSQIGCSTWDWDNQICLKCSNLWVFSKSQCVPVDEKCSSFDSTSGACTSCFAGYLLKNGQCNQANPLCKTSDSNGKCLSCFTGYIKVTGSCIPISKLANINLYYAECCPEKLTLLQKGNSASG